MRANIDTIEFRPRTLAATLARTMREQFRHAAEPAEAITNPHEEKSDGTKLERKSAE